MRPPQLKPEHFASYPPLGREVAVRGIDLLRQLPLSFVPLLLREVISFDWNFPPERREVDAQFTYLGGLSQPQLQDAMRQFVALKLSPEMSMVAPLLMLSTPEKTTMFIEAVEPEFRVRLDSP